MDPSVRYFIKDLYIADWFTSSDDTLDDQYVSPTFIFTTNWISRKTIT